MDFIYIACMALLGLAAWGLALGCARLQSGRGACT